MNISKTLVATIHIIAMIAAGTVQAVAADGTFAADAAGTEGRNLQSTPKPIHSVIVRGGHRFDRLGWYNSHRAENRRPVMVKHAR